MPAAPKPKPPDRLTRRQEVVLAALMVSPTYRAASQATGVPERTVRFWLRHVTAFAEEYRVRRQEAFDQAAAAAERLLLQAVVRLGRNLDCDHKPASNRAAAALWDIAVKARQQGDLARQVAELERLVREKLGPKGRKP